MRDAGLFDHVADCLRSERLRVGEIGIEIIAVVRLGDASGIRVVAEYVENREQQRILAELGCNEFQGYLYSRPLPAPECLDYLRSHTPAAAAERAV